MNRSDLLVRIDSEFKDKGFKSAEASAKSLVRELDRQEAEVRRMANLQMQAHREDQARQAQRLASMEKVGRGFTAVGLLAAAGLGLAAKSAMDWESAWAGVTKTVNGSTEEMAALEGQLREMAKSLPATHEEIAAVAAAAGQLGVKRQDVASFTKTMIDLGESTNLSAEDAATSLARLANVMGTLPADANRAGSAIVELGNNSATTEREIVDMAMRIAGAGRQVGMSEAQVLGFSAALSSVGIEAEAGGSAISRVMVDISQSVEQGGEKLDTFARVAGMSSAEFSRRFKTDAAGAITAFIGGLGRMQKSGQDVFGTLDEVGFSQVRVRDALLRSAAAGDLLTKSVDMGAQAWDKNTALVDEANKRYETAESRIKMARNQLNDAAIDIGGTVLPVLAGAAERVGALAKTFQALPGPVKESVAILGGVVAVAGTLGGAALILIPKIVAMNAALESTGPKGASAAAGLRRAGSALAGPWGLALAGATIALGVYAEKQYQAKQRVAELKQAIDTQTGSLNDSGRALQASALQTEGLFDIAREAGVSVKTLTAAASGQTDALRELEDMQKKVQGGADSWRDAQNAAAASTGTLADAVDVGASSFGGLGDAQAQSAQSASEQNAKLLQLLATVRPMHDQVRELAGAEAEVDAAAGSAATSTDSLTAAIDQNAQAAQMAQDEIDALMKAVKGYGDTVNAALDATSSYEASLDDATAAVKKNGKTATKAKDEINLHTEAGRANDKALRGIASAALDAATANFENGDSVESVTKSTMAARDEFVKMSVRMGLSKKAANELADQLGLTEDNVGSLSQAIGNVPKSHETNMIVRTEKAKAAADALASYINGIRLGDKSIHVRYVEVGPRPGGGRSLGGGITKDFDVGGYTGDIPQHAVAGRVHGQEFVVQPNPTRKYRDMLEAMNAGQDPARFLRLSPTVNVTVPSGQAAASPSGPMEITGVMDLGNGLKGYVRGQIAQAATTASRSR